MPKEIQMGKNGLPKVRTYSKKKNNKVLSSQRWHVTRNGEPKICTSKKGRCRIDSEDNHFPTWAEALTFVRESNSNGKSAEVKVNREDIKYSKSKLALSKSSKDYIKLRLKTLKRVDSKNAVYASRCFGSIRVSNFKENEKESGHSKLNRKERTILSDKISSKREFVAAFRVNHAVYGKNKAQLVKVYSDGFIEIYCGFSKRKITSFLASENRIEVMFLKAGEIPDPDFLKIVRKNSNEYVIESKKLGLDF